MSASAQKKLELFTIEGHKLHLFRTGDVNKPKLIFMSGSGTAAPMYDFKILYEKLIEDFRIIVIEKFGYGYSDLFEASCETDCVIDRQRKVLQEAGEMGPYILVPHSLSGLEAIRWKQKYPDEVKAIIGLDMATPKIYLAWNSDEIDRRISIIKKMKKAKEKGLLFWFPLNKRALTKEEIKEQKKIWKKNAFNECYIKEAEAVLNNAEKVAAAGIYSYYHIPEEEIKWPAVPKDEPDDYEEPAPPDPGGSGETGGETGGDTDGGDSGGDGGEVITIGGDGGETGDTGDTGGDTGGGDTGGEG